MRRHARWPLNISGRRFNKISIFTSDVHSVGQTGACLSSPEDFWTRLSARTSIRQIFYTLKSVYQSLEELREEMLYSQLQREMHEVWLMSSNDITWIDVGSQRFCKPLIHIVSSATYHFDIRSSPVIPTLALAFSCLTRLSHLEVNVVVME